MLSTNAVPGPPGNGAVSIGVAIALPQRVANVVQRVRTQTGDPLAGVIPPHVTLLPPTQVPSRALPRIRHHLLVAAGHLPQFRLRLAGTGTFRPVSKVVFLQVTEGAQNCDELQRLINTGILHRPLQFAYHPHVTLGHDVAEEQLDAASRQLADFVADIEVADFGLYRFDSDGRWRVDTLVRLGCEPRNVARRSW